MKIPYNELKLNIAFLSFCNKLELNPDAMKQIEAISEKFAVLEPIPQRVAEHHGITALELANSSNRDVLKEEYVDHVISSLIADIEKIGFNNDEAWAFFAKGMGKI